MLERIILAISLTLQLAGLTLIADHTVALEHTRERMTQLILKTH